MRFLGGPGFGPDDSNRISTDGGEGGGVGHFLRNTLYMHFVCPKNFHRAFVRIPTRKFTVGHGGNNDEIGITAANKANE